jgi:Fe-S cluster assembly ATP-binding protein
MTDELVVAGLEVSIGGKKILKGLDLTVRQGEVHALMGPNGSGKSTLAHVLMGRDDYEVTAGSVTIDGDELLGLPTWQRAAHGLFLASQYPVAVPGVPVGDLVGAAVRARGAEIAGLDARLRDEASRLDIRDEFLDRGVNDEFSGGEQKRMETLQLAVLEPAIAILDETDSGLDIDALKAVAGGIDQLAGPDLGLLLITHYQRILDYVTPDHVHVLMGGRIVRSGGPDLARELEAKGYEGLRAELGIEAETDEVEPERAPR